MRSGLRVVLATGLVTALLGGLLTGNAAPAAAVAAPAHTLEVTGPGVGSYPAYDPAVERYAVTTTQATGGTLTVHATTTDPAGVVRVDGRVAPGGTATLSGLADGDEVSVFIEDSAGTEVHSLVYLPAGFPALEVTQSAPGLAPGVVGLTLFNFADPTKPRLLTTVDRNGVPAHVERKGALDLKVQPDGSVTYFLATTTPGRTGDALVVVDKQWHEVARYETVGLKNTDSHDGILLPDGTHFLIAYEPNSVTGKTDAVIQKLDKSNTVLWQWSTEGLESETVLSPSAADYAHINAIFLAPDGTGDLIASFRHFSSVFRIATQDHDGYAAGDIVWKLGGRDSSFDFPDDPLGGPCAQHAASILPNGNVLLYDNGSGGLSDHLCVNQADPQGATLNRDPWQSRAVEYQLDTVNHHAHVVWSYGPPGRYAWFMGWASRLSSGHTFIGWSSAVPAIASEVDASQHLLWELQLANSSDPTPYISYRAALMDIPDAEDPVIDASTVPAGGQYMLDQKVTVDFGCTDRGGSSLRDCGGDVRPGGTLDTSSPGQHMLRLLATDGAGNTTTVTRSYTVTATYQPGWTDDVVRTTLRGRHVATNVTVVNDGTYADTFTLLGTRGSPRVGVRYKVGSTDVTHDVRHGLLRTPVLQPGQSFVLRVVATRTHRTRHGTHRTVEVRATSLAGASTDIVAVKVRAR
jgi:hypothetical protein